MYYSYHGVLYQPQTINGTLVLRKAAVGSTKTEGGITYRLNRNHRWERTGESAGQLSLLGDTLEPVNQPKEKAELLQDILNLADRSLDDDWEEQVQSYVNSLSLPECFKAVDAAMEYADKTQMMEPELEEILNPIQDRINQA